MGISSSLFLLLLGSTLFSYCTYLRTVGVETDSRSILLQPRGGTLDLKQMSKAITVCSDRGSPEGVVDSPTELDASHSLFLFLFYLQLPPREGNR